ncbi:MAG: ABC transporter permease [Deltaproteobacteria bacterium]|nr:ABC transporter permease [Deltaproteobacteria bacterium]
MLKICYRNYKVWSRYIGSSLVANLGEPLLYLLAMGFGVGHYVQQIDGRPYPQFIAPALVVVAIMNAATFETTFSSYTRLAVQKTFDAMAVTPLSVRDIVFGEILWAAIKGMFSAVIIMAVLASFGLIRSPWALMALPLGFVEGLLFAAIGLLVSAYANGYEVFNYYFTLFVSPMFLFSGTFFPLNHMPNLVQKLAWIFPLTYASQGAREVFFAMPGKVYFKSFFCLLLMMIPLTYWVLKKMERKLIV